jgi:hypothetical protein
MGLLLIGDVLRHFRDTRVGNRQDSITGTIRICPSGKRETVKTVKLFHGAINTPLKQGVNETALRMMNSHAFTSKTLAPRFFVMSARDSSSKFSGETNAASK